MIHVPAHKNVQHPAGQVDGGGTIAFENAIFRQTVQRACITRLGKGDKVVHVPTGCTGIVMRVNDKFIFVDFGSKANPFTWVCADSLQPA